VRPRTKGRQVDPGAAERVRALLGDRPRRRDLLIEHLHLIQDSQGCLAPDDMAALAEEMKLSLTEVYEVATFYAHFDVLGDEDARPPPVTVRVCDSLTCEMMGADALIAALEESVGEGVRIVRAPCIGACDRAPAAEVGHNQMSHATPERVTAAIAESRTRPEIPSYTGFDDYVASGGYALLRACRDGARSVESVIEALEESNLRGLGGAFTVDIGGADGRARPRQRQRTRPPNARGRAGHQRGFAFHLRHVAIPVNCSFPLPVS